MIEQNIIASVFSEDRYNEVGFLIKHDFSIAANAKLWEGISHYKGDLLQFIASLELADRKDWLRAVEYNCSAWAIYSLTELGIQLVELSYKRNLDRLLRKLSEGSTDAMEIYLLNEAKKEIPNADIFDLSESLNDYFGDKVSINVRARIKDYNDWRNKRTSEIKKYLN